jgi:uncharacterized protein (DUF433 family)
MNLEFDHHQFEGHGKYPVSATSGIAFSDYDRMHTESHKAKPTAWVPPFALNDKQLQAVLLRRAWRYAFHLLPFPENVNREELNRAATGKALKGYAIKPGAPPVQHEMRDRHIAAVRRAGGYMELQAAIAFRAWRLGQDSVAVADSLGMTPWAVRVQLWRLRDVAKKLGFEVGRAGYTTGLTRSTRIDIAQAVEMYNNGSTIKEISAHCGYAGGSGCGAVRQRLRAAGVKMRNQGRPKPPTLVDVKLAARLRNEGMTFTEIAKQFGCAHMTVHNALCHAGLHMRITAFRPRKRRPKGSLVDVQLAAHLRGEGMSYKAIAKQFGCTLTTIFSALCRAGLHVRVMPPRKNRATIGSAVVKSEP